MIYSKWANRENSPLVSKLGFGTTRFMETDLKSDEGFSKCVDLVEKAIDLGINYFDVAPTYSYGYAEKILGQAFKCNNKKIYVAAKTGLTIDETCDDLLKRAEKSLKTLNVDVLDFYHIWAVMNYDQYKKVISKNGLYEGALKAKENGLINNICISLHCDTNEVLKILQDDLFDGITISLNPMNYKKWIPVLEMAESKKVAVATMNSLAGGIIPKYPKLFEKIDGTNSSSQEKALRFLAQFKAVSVILSGMATEEELKENCSVFESEIKTKSINKIKSFEIPTTENLCSGCNYCSPCSVGIPIADLMQGYNHKILLDSSETQMDEQRKINSIFIKLRANGVQYLDIAKCIDCRLCEERCTQKINISERIRYLEAISLKHGYEKMLMKQRLSEIEKMLEPFEKVAIFPSSMYATQVLDFWNNKKLEEKFCYFNSSKELQGQMYRGKKVFSPTDIEKMGFKAVLVMHYNLRKEIIAGLNELNSEIKIIDLHNDNDINWFDMFER